MYRVHHASGYHFGDAKQLDDAAALAANVGEGATIRLFGRVLFTQGVDGDANDFDTVRDVVDAKLRA